MATPAQITANIENSKKSTGPRTEAGKAASSRNRLSHGFASSIKIIAGEDPQEFKMLHHDLTLEYQPATPTEQILVEKMVVHQWLSLRALRLQSEIFRAQDSGGDLFAIPSGLSLLIRYQTAAERAFHRAHNELVKAQKERKKSEIGFEPQLPVEAPEADPKIRPETAPAAGLPFVHASSAAPSAHQREKILTDADKFLQHAA